VAAPAAEVKEEASNKKDFQQAEFADKTIAKSEKYAGSADAAGAAAIEAVPAEGKAERTDSWKKGKDGKDKEKGKQGSVHREEYLPLDPKIFAEIKEQYGISDQLDPGQLYTRTNTAKTIYYVTKTIKAEFLDRPGIRDLRVVCTGLKLFEKNERQGVITYRLQQEGLHVLLGHATKKVVGLSQEDYQVLIDKRGGLLPISSFSEEGQKQLNSEEIGCVACYLKGDEAEAAVGAGSSMQGSRLGTVVWRGKYCLNVLCTKHDGMIMIEHMKAKGVYKEKAKKVAEPVAKRKAGGEGEGDGVTATEPAAKKQKAEEPAAEAAAEPAAKADESMQEVKAE